MSQIGGWEAVRQAVRQRIGVSAFDAWFETLEGSIEGGTLVLRCPDRFSRDWIRGRYGGAVVEAAVGVQAIDYRIASQPARPAIASEPPARPDEGTETPRDPPQPCFDSFVTGPSNALAFQAAQAIAEGKAGRCNPLVLTAASGLGKTHLCRAIRRAVGTRALYRSSEDFTSEVTLAMRERRMEMVRHRYRRSHNVLILEDIQFLEGKRATQMELFHTVDHLLAHGRPVVLSADRPPAELEGLDPRLRSRFSSGLVACIAPPELETAGRILREKAANGGVHLPEEALELLLQRPFDNVASLLAGLNQVVARASLLRQRVTAELVREAISAVAPPGRRHGLEEILELTARFYAVTPEELRGRSRRRRIVQPRQFAMYLCREYTDASLKEIGRAFGRDHTTVVHAIAVVERRALERPQLRYELEALAARLSPTPPPRSGVGSTRDSRRS